MSGLSIPEMIGFSPVPFEREALYSVKSYQALYCLTEEEAKEIRDSYVRHSQVDLALSKRYLNDTEYHERVDKACEDISDTEPREEIRRIMRRLVSTMNPPTEEARQAVEETIGELPEDKDGAA